MPQEDKFRVLLVGNDPKFGQILPYLATLGYEAEQAEKGFEALQKIAPDPIKYDFVLLDSELDDMDGLNLLGAIGSEDKYLPVMVLGKEDQDIAAKAIRAGALYYVNKSRADFFDEVGKHLQKRLVFSTDVGKTTVIKVGGSISLYEEDNPKSDNLERAVRSCTAGNRPGGSLIATTGAGGFGYQLKSFLDHHRAMGDVDANFARNMKTCVELNVRCLCNLFGSLAEYVSPYKFAKVDKDFLSTTIPVMNVAPVPVFRKHRIPFNDSDTQTIAIAEFYRAERLILLKRTDGIYLYDPYNGFKSGASAWGVQQKDNKRLQVVYAEDLLSDEISRVGAYDGRGNHLIEETAIKYFIERAKTLKEILIVHIAPEEMFVKDTNITANLRLRHVVDPSIQYKPLEEQLFNAFKGQSYSKIVRERPS